MNVDESNNKALNFQSKNSTERTEYSSQACALSKKIITSNKEEIVALKYYINAHEIIPKEFNEMVSNLKNNNYIKELYLGRMFYEAP